jgi:cystathionine beta-lyase
VACPSGLSAISISVLSCVSAGDHILVADNVYRPARRFFDNTLARFGVSVGYVDPHSIDKLSDAIRPNTRVLYTEIPGALSGEVIDFPKAATIAHEHGLTVLCDNTWATPLFFDAFAHGADMCIQSGTKYLAGHSDVVIGCVSASVTHAARLRDQANEIGTCVGPDDLFLTLRGMRSLALRLRQHQASALTIARWLEARLEVLNVLHPALESHPDHAIWRRDFAGATGLFSVIFAPDTKSKISEMLNSLELFGIGISWGGFESLIIPFDCTASRTATKWEPGGPTVRFSIGLEDPTDLIHDLEQAFKLFRHI